MSFRSSSSSLHQFVCERQYQQRQQPSFFRGVNRAKNNLDVLQRLSLVHTLDDHRGCVNTVAWNASGSILLSGSDDHRLILTDPYSKKVLCDISTSHRANIFSAKFLSTTNDSKIVSCAGDGTLVYTDVERLSETHNCSFNCHSGTAYEVLTPPGDPHSFLSCGEDGTVRWFDLRTKQKCNKTSCKGDILISCRSPVTSIALNPVRSYHLAVGASDSTVRVFDRRMLGTKNTGQSHEESLDALVSRFSVPALEGKHRRITSVDYRPDGEEILASYSSDYIYLFEALANDASRSKKLFVGRDNKPSRGGSGARGIRGGPSGGGAAGEKSPPPMKRLRLRGDWSDTGPNARPEGETEAGGAGASVASDTQQLTAADFLRSPPAGEDREAEAGGPSTAAEQPPATSSTRSRNNDVPESSDEAGETNEQPDNLHGGNLMQRMTDALSRMLNDPSTRLAMRSMQESRESRRQQQQQRQQEVAGSSSSDVPSEGTGEQARLETEGNGSAEAEVEEGETGPTAAGSTTVRRRLSSAGNDILEEDGGGGGVDAWPGEGRRTSDGNAERRISDIQESISSMREEYVERHHSEPDVSLRYSAQGPSASTITIPRGPSPTSTAEGDSSGHGGRVSQQPLLPEMDMNLPGPSQVVTHPGNSGQNPITGVTPNPPSARTRPSFPTDLDTELDDYSADDPEHEEGQIPGAAYEFEEEEEDQDEDTIGDARPIPQPPVFRRLVGHRNARTMIKEATWWGNNYILSGSDCGHIFGWERATGRLILLLEADRHVVNCVQPHPLDPILASSGIDYNVKLWAPMKPEIDFDHDAADLLVHRNEKMLEETRDTITVPATLMIRMLASLNQIRRAGRIIPRVLERRRVRAGAGEDDDHELDRDSDDNDQPPMGSDSEDSHNDEFIDVGEMLAAGNDPEDDDDENEASQASTEEL